MPLLYIRLAMKFSYSLSQDTAWPVLVRVDNVTYSFLGAALGMGVNNTVNLTNIVVTPSQIVLTAQAGPMQVNLTFLNPIEVRFHPSANFHCLKYAP